MELKFSLFILIQFIAVSFTATPTNKQLPNQIPLPNLPNQEFLPNQTYILIFYTPWCHDSSKVLSMMYQLHQDYKKTNIPFTFYKVDGTKEKQLVEQMNIRGFPAIRIINKNKWGLKGIEYIYDIKKEEFQYFLEKEFGILPHFNSVEQFEQSKNDYQIVLSANKAMYPAVYLEFFNASLNNSLYFFNTINPLQQFYTNYWIPIDEEDINDSCFIILLQRPNNYDKRFDCSSMKKSLQLQNQGKINEANELNEKFKQELKEFIQMYQKPWMFYKLNHKIKKFIIEHEFYCVALFSRKKTKQIEKITRDTYLNGTRDLKHEMKVKNNQNFQEFYSDFVEKTQFLYLDIEKPMERRLAHFIGIEEQEVPLVTAFYFDKDKKEIVKYKSPKSQFHYNNFFAEAMSALHYQNQEYNSFKRVLKPQENKQQSLEQKKQHHAWNLNYWNIERFFSLKLPSRANLPTLWVIIYTASYCIHSKKADLLFTKVSDQYQEIFNNKAVNINFGRAELYGQDFPAKYGRVPDSVPEIRIYFDEKKFEIIENLENEKQLVEKIAQIDKAFVKEEYWKKNKNKKEDL